MSENSEPGLVIRLRGGLGNQMFQYASAWAIARRNGAKLYLDIETGFQGDPFARRFDLGNFAVSAPQISSNEAALMAPHSFWTTYYWRRELLRTRWLSEYHDTSLHNLRIRKPVLLDNYLQSPLYFEDCAPAIRTELAVTAPYPGEAAPDGIGDPDSVCVHARRNHGVTAAGSTTGHGYYGAYSIAYYRACMDAILAERPAAKFFFFGDDRDWIRTELLPSCPGGTLVQSTSDIEDFRLMTKCTHFVLANSTFSWWGAWLGTKPGSIVCCGTTWNRGERRPPKNLLPVSWRRIHA